MALLPGRSRHRATRSRTAAFFPPDTGTPPRFTSAAMCPATGAAAGTGAAPPRGSPVWPPAPRPRPGSSLPRPGTAVRWTVPPGRYPPPWGARKSTPPAGRSGRKTPPAAGTGAGPCRGPPAAEPPPPWRSWAGRSLCCPALPGPPAGRRTPRRPPRQRLPCPS